MNGIQRLRIRPKYNFSAEILSTEIVSTEILATRGETAQLSQTHSVFLPALGGGLGTVRVRRHTERACYVVEKLFRAR
jgi:hypothetical protein